MEAVKALVSCFLWTCLGLRISAYTDVEVYDVLVACHSGSALEGVLLPSCVLSRMLCNIIMDIPATWRVSSFVLCALESGQTGQQIHGLWK